MSRVKKLVGVILLLLIVVQFIRPGRNTSSQPMPNDISKMVATPDSIKSVLQTACYDCHSNNSKYPWYMNIQPMGWLMAKHIREGKEVLNFSEFGGYSRRRQVSKLKAVGSSIEDGSMPLSSYTLLHKDARLSTPAKRMIIEWSTDIADSLRAVK